LKDTIQKKVAMVTQVIIFEEREAGKGGVRVLKGETCDPYPEKNLVEDPGKICRVP